MKKILAILLIILIICVAVTLIGGGAFLFKWYSCAKTKSVPEITSRSIPEKTFEIGEKIPCTFQVKTSWSLMPVNAAVTPAEGIQEAGNAEITTGKWQWGTRLWNVTVWIQPYRDGEYADIPVRILCEGGPDGKALAETSIPSFKVILPETAPDQKIEIAEQVDETQKKKKRTFVWYLVAGGVLLLAILLWLIIRFRKRKNTPSEPVWITALNMIAELRKSFSEKAVSPESAVIRLTDIVRHFLEKQFSLPAEHQTTPEFLTALRSSESPLDVEQRQFLREFLSSADMVKFARLSVDESLFDNAAQRAESLIRNTAQEFQIKEKVS